MRRFIDKLVEDIDHVEKTTYPVEYRGNSVDVKVSNIRIAKRYEDAGFPWWPTVKCCYLFFLHLQMLVHTL